MNQGNRDQIKRMLFEYEITLEKIIPESLQREDPNIGEEIYHLLTCRDWLEARLFQDQEAHDCAALKQKVEELDRVMVERRRLILSAFPELEAQRERLRVPPSRWWWYLDRMDAEASSMLSQAGQEAKDKNP